MKKLLGLTSMLFISGFAVSAATIAPNYTSFGTLSGATFGGTGIPNNAVAITTIANGGDTITLGLSATPRYSAPAVGNNGAGTFYATPGTASGKSLWNFDYYISVNNSDFANYTFALLYESSASALTTMAYGPVAVAVGDEIKAGGGTTYTTVSGTTAAQDSETLSFGYLGTPIGFDPNANSVYSFELVAYDATGAAIGNCAINVNVRDAASTAGLLGLGFLALAAFGFRQNRLAMAK